MLFTLKKIAKALLYRPKLGRLGKNSYIRRPRWIAHGRCVEIGDDCSIGHFAIISSVTIDNDKMLMPKIVLGNDVYIGGFVQLHAMDRIEIGDGCVLSEHVYISDIAHGLDPKGIRIMSQPLESRGPVTIGKRNFIGFGSSVLPGVTLGDNCIVGTGSVVTKSFPGGSMIAGVPARLLKSYDHESGTWRPADGST